jgi:hypothetical protein
MAPLNISIHSKDSRFCPSARKFTACKWIVTIAERERGGERERGREREREREQENIVLCFIFKD